MKRIPLRTLALPLAAVAAVALGAVLARGGATAPALTTVDVATLHAALAEPGAAVTLIDVREPHEYHAGHVAGAASMPLADTVPLALAADLPKGEPVWVICRSGNRSLQAAHALVDAGFTDVRNVSGGMLAWEAAGHPVAR